LELDEELVLLTPLIADGINDDDLKIYLLEQLIINSGNIAQYADIADYISKKELSVYFNRRILGFIEFLQARGYKYTPVLNQQAFLHNIYYEYISNKYKNSNKASKYKNNKIDFIFTDARKSLKQLGKKFDVVFLDGFSPQKSPLLWTIDFLSLLKQKMNNNSILVTYSKSAPFRSALLELGFHIGKTYLNNFDMGTVASVNKNNIINNLNEYDYNLYKTTAGIYYKDPGLNYSADTIINNRNLEIKSSGRISHTQFIKKYGKIL